MVLWVELCPRPQDLYVEVLLPGPQNMTLFVNSTCEQAVATLRPSLSSVPRKLLAD